jgi:hypothetical protein
VPLAIVGGEKLVGRRKHGVLDSHGTQQKTE